MASTNLNRRIDSIIYFYLGRLPYVSLYGLHAESGPIGHCQNIWRRWESRSRDETRAAKHVGAQNVADTPNDLLPHVIVKLTSDYGRSSVGNAATAGS